MSYILDALQRAHAERERAQLRAGGSVPGLLSQVTAAPPHAGPRRWGRRALALGGGLALISLGMVVGMGWRPPSDAPPSPKSVVAAGEVARPRLNPTPPSASASSTQPGLPAARSAWADSPKAVSLGAAKPPRRPVAEAGGLRVRPRTADSARELGVPKQPPLLAQLPAAQRQAIPALAVSGSVYSTEASSRFLMIKGEVVREGMELAPGWVLEEIRPQEIVLLYQGLRYRQAL